MIIAGASSALPKHKYDQRVLLYALKEFWGAKLENPFLLNGSTIVWALKRATWPCPWRNIMGLPLGVRPIYQRLKCLQKFETRPVWGATSCGPSFARQSNSPNKFVKSGIRPVGTVVFPHSKPCDALLALLVGFLQRL